MRLTDAPSLAHLKPRPPTKLIGIKGTPDLHKRLRVAAAEEGLSYADLLDLLLTLREDRLRRHRAAQKHPLSRPARNEVVLNDNTLADVGTGTGAR